MLTPQEVRQLVVNVRQLVAHGLAIIFITHKLDEVMAFSDRVTVLRGGRVEGRVRTAETDPAALARLMVGRDVVLRLEKAPDRPRMGAATCGAGGSARNPACAGPSRPWPIGTVWRSISTRASRTCPSACSSG